MTVIDGDDGSLRASRGNFGLIWVQSKGLKQTRYAQWTQNSAAAWRGFADELSDLTGTDLGLRQEGGLDLHFSESTLAATVQQYEGLRGSLGGNYPFEVLGANALRKEEPHIGPKVVGAILHHQDGHANPLRLLQALADGVRRRGAYVLNGQQVKAVDKADIFRISCNDGTQVRAQIGAVGGIGRDHLGSQTGVSRAAAPAAGTGFDYRKTAQADKPPIHHRAASG